MQLGQTIVKIRKEHELTQEEFAKEFNVTRQTVSNWENEKSYPDLLTLVKISDMFGCSLDSMLKENPDMTEAMNKSIQLGNAFRKKSKTNLIVAVIGIICCTVMCILSFIDYDGILAPVVWLAAVLINARYLIDYYKSNKIIETNGDLLRNLNADDIETLKQLINHDMTVEAVKMVRKITGLGLVEAKTFVDEIQNQGN